MSDQPTWRKAWSMLDPRERRGALLTLGVMMIAAAASAAMVGSVLPFLSVLSDPEQIWTTPAYSWAYRTGGFTAEYSFVAALGGLAIAVIFLSMLVLICCTYVISRFATMRVHALSTRLFANYLGRPWEFFLDRNSGSLGSSILSECQMVVDFFFRPAADLTTALLTFIAITLFLFWLNPVVTGLAILVLTVLYGSIFALVQRSAKRIGKSRVSANDARFRVANEALGGVKEIKLLAQESAFVNRFAEPSQTVARSIIWLEVLSQTPRYLIQACALGGMIALSLLLLDPAEFAGGDALREIIPLLGVFAFAGQRMMPELQKGYQAWVRMRYGAAAVDRIYADLNAYRAKAEGDDTDPPLPLRHSLRFDDVVYGYPNAERPSLASVSLDIRAGETIGVVGRTGAGKSTLVEIALGLLEPNSGRVLADGTVLAGRAVRRWQRSVAYVPQTIYLSDASVAENVALGIPRAEIDENRLRRACAAAQLTELIETALPKGYDSQIGERGVRLSGGQRQRIGIARALYRDADLIVLDEATSALDTATERDLMQAISERAGQQTILMIAHRLSTVRSCDRIVVLEEGQIVGIGDWETLLAQNPAFQELARVADAA